MTYVVDVLDWGNPDGEKFDSDDINFDKLVKQINDKEVATQSFLAPYSFKLGAKESQTFDLII